MPPSPAIDVHFHAIPPAFAEAVRRRDLADVLEFTQGDLLAFHAPPHAAIEPGLALRPRVYDTPQILAALGRMRLDAAAVSPPPEFFMSWAPPEAAGRIARTINDGYAQWAAAHPTRLVPLATLPMQDPARAAREARRAFATLGLRGAAICTHVDGKDLDDPSFAPVYAELEAAAAPLFLHPQNQGDPTRLAPYHLWNAIGFPTETTTAAARLILSGTLARHPNLKIILAHGGGFLPYQLGRLDHAWHARAALRQTCPEPPSTYLRQIWCDSLVHDPTALRFLVDRVGPGQVVLGTDHPFDMGDPNPLDSLSVLSGEAVGQIAGQTLADLLRLSD